MGIEGVEPARRMILRFARQFGAGCFVETGALLGQTARWAAGHFPRVVTIEKSASHFQRAREACASLGTVQVLPGDSRQVLPGLLADLPAPSVFWLDAHWSGQGTAGEGDECPLRGELEAICGAPGGHLIFIDDARLFLAPPPRPHRAEQWPSAAEVLGLLGRSAHRYQAAVLHDVMVACPGDWREQFVRLMQDLATEAWAARAGPGGAEGPP